MGRTPKCVKLLEYSSHLLYFIFRDLAKGDDFTHNEVMAIVNQLTNLAQPSVTPHLSKPHPNGRKCLQNLLPDNKITVTVSELLQIHVDTFNSFFFAHFTSPNFKKIHSGVSISLESHSYIIGELFQEKVISITLDSWKKRITRLYDYNVPLNETEQIEKQSSDNTSVRHIEVLCVVDSCYLWAWIDRCVIYLTCSSY